MTLVQAGFLLSLVQAAGMLLGVAFGVLADGLGPKRSMVLGLCLLAAASGLGGLANGVPMLMVLRMFEGFGLLLVVLPAPGLLRQLVPPQRVNVMLGVWGTYMPLATALALLLGPLCIAAFGWRGWWWALAAVSLAMAAVVALAVPAASTAASAAPLWLSRLRQTLTARGPWLVAMPFAAYSAQWGAVIGFLPTIYAQAGISGATTGALTALAAAVNMLGNLAAGRLLQRGVAPTRLLSIAFVSMALAAVAAFAGTPSGGLTPELRYLAVLLFSMIGGLVPATLFSLAVRVAPSARTLSTTVGWLQQWSALGQFAGPPLVAWVASQAGGWHLTWVATGACALAGLLLTRRLGGLAALQARAP